MITRTLLTPASITATGRGPDLDVSGLAGKAQVILTARNTAGTSPTLACKIQGATGLARGYEISTLGATANELREGATTNVKISASFTQDGARSIKRVALRLKKGGTLTAGKVLTLTIEADSAGDPSGTPLGTAGTVDIDTVVTTSFAWVVFTFATPVDVSDATVYHLVLAGDYTESASNNVMWSSSTVASGGNFEAYDATNWANTTTKALDVFVDQYTFTDLTGGTFTTLETALNTTVQTKEFNSRSLPQFMSLYSTIGGTSNPAFATAAVVSSPRVQEQ